MRSGAGGILAGGKPRFPTIVACGGVGSGRFFLLDGDHTLGREESRGGRFLDRRDYCKGHIVCHYLKVLLGAPVEVALVGAVGDDEAGRALWREMERAGIDLRCARRLAGAPTLFSFCFLYPDGSGGNMTTNDSASGRVGPADVDRSRELLVEAGAAAMVAALPEVPLAARRRLLELASATGGYRAAAFTSQEMADAVRFGDLERTDLLALNAHEAVALLRAWGAPPAAGGAGDAPPAEVAAALAGLLSARSSPRAFLMTAGKDGSWSWWGDALLHEPAIPVDAVGTAGAGDAHLAGLLAGLARGYEPLSAHRLGALVAAASVTSPHTIHPTLDRRALDAAAERASWGSGGLEEMIGVASGSRCRGGDA